MTNDQQMAAAMAQQGPPLTFSDGLKCGREMVNVERKAGEALVELADYIAKVESNNLEGLLAVLQQAFDLGTQTAVRCSELRRGKL